MKKLMMCCMFALMGCGDEAEEPKPLGPPPTLTVTIGEKVCQRDLPGRPFEGTLVFQVNARIEASAPLRDFRCSGVGTKGEDVRCSGPPEMLDGPWEGVVSCDLGDWNRDSASQLRCFGISTEDGQDARGRNFDGLFVLRKCDPATDI